MANKFYYTENNNNKPIFIEIINIIKIIKTFCSINNKSLGSNYLNYSNIYNKDDLLNDPCYNNKCVIIQYDDRWELIEKVSETIETGWFYTNKIKQNKLVVLQTYHIMKVQNNEYINEVENIIESNEFSKLLDHKVIKNCLLMGKYLDILFSKCKEITILIHFIDACDDLEFIDENNKKLVDYVIENPTDVTLEIIKYLVNNKKINVEYANKNGYKLVHNIISFYNRTHFYKNIYEEILCFLIGLDIDLISMTNKGWNLLHYVCAFGSDNLIKTLIMQCKCKYEDCDQNIINGKTKDGDTPLHLICKYKYGINIIKFMIDNGADKTIYNDKKYLPFNYIPVGLR